MTQVSKVWSRLHVWGKRRTWHVPARTAPICDTWKVQSLAGLEESERHTLIEEAERYAAGKFGPPSLLLRAEEAVCRIDSGFVKRQTNRHHHLTVLALGYVLTGNSKYAQEVERQLERWAEASIAGEDERANPLEAGIRLIAWVWIERLLRGSEAHTRLFGDQGVLWPSIYRQQRSIAVSYSRGSGADSRLLAEMAGLYIASSVWRCYPESVKWSKLAKRLLEREAGRQIFAGGLSREQSFAYHLFALEAMLLAALEGERCEDAFSPAYADTIRRMLEVVPYVTDVSGQTPRYGDDDQPIALQLRSAVSAPLDYLYRIGLDWLGAEVPEPYGDAGKLAARLLLPVQSPAERNSPEQRRGGRRSAGHGWAPARTEDSGHYVLSSRRGSREEVFAWVDAAPLGYLSGTHGHADALAFTLSVGGEPIIVDPGTYGCGAEPQWVSYFRGTRAHNTVTVDGVDQSQSQSVATGALRWERAADVSVVRWQPTGDGGNGSLTAEHNGYARLAEPVTHRRTFRLEGSQFTLEDELHGKGMHTADFRLHFAPNCNVNLPDAEHCLVVWSGGCLDIKLDGRLEWRLLRGDPSGGWYSPEFGIRQPCMTLSGTIRASVPLSFMTEIDIYIQR